MWQIINTYIIGLTTTSVMLVFGRILLNKKISFSVEKTILTVMLIALIYSGSYLLFENVSKTLTMFFIDIITYKYVFKISIKKSIFLTFLYMILLLIPELIELYILINILGLSREFCYETYAGSLISNLFVWILFISMTYLLKKPLRKLLTYEIENSKQIIVFSILIFICVGMFFYTLITKLRFNDNIILYLVAMLILILVLFSLIRQMIQNNKLTEQYDKLLEFMVTYENEIENQRILRHEVKNEFRTIRAKICDKQANKEIIEYIDEIVNDKYEVNKEKYAKFGYLPPNGIKGLCYFKTQEAEDKGINVSLNISKKIKESTIYNLDIKQQRDFGRILGVFLDNAIEASIESKEKQIGIEAYTNTKKEFKMIISNTYKNKIDKNKLGKESFSTKGKNRGHGLLLAKQLVGKNNIFETKTEIQENIYIQTIEIKKL